MKCSPSVAWQQQTAHPAHTHLKHTGEDSSLTLWPVRYRPAPALLLKLNRDCFCPLPCRTCSVESGCVLVSMCVCFVCVCVCVCVCEALWPLFLRPLSFLLSAAPLTSSPSGFCWVRTLSQIRPVCKLSEARFCPPKKNEMFNFEEARVESKYKIKKVIMRSNWILYNKMSLLW